MDFYADKSRTLPRFVYRNLLALLERPGASREEAILAFATFLATLKPRGEWLKMKWCMPPALATRLTAAERTRVEAVIAARRDRRNDRYIEVYPHCTDEYSLEIPFLDAAFGSDRRELFSRRTRLFTIGSCFARNIATWLSARGYDIETFQQLEDLNSPYSNAKLLAICAASDEEREEYIAHWIRRLYPEEMLPRMDELLAAEIVRLDRLRDSVANAAVLIVTCGNVIDYFLPAGAGSNDHGAAVAPKFLAISISADVERQAFLLQRMREQGTRFRLGTAAETRTALESQYASLRRLNPRARVVFTLSPVPIDSAVGIENPHGHGAITLDCISKSTLRVAMAEFLDAHAGDDSLVYFPSFEIARWIAPNLGRSVFGFEDACSRHVSQHVLDGIYRYFLHRHGREEAGQVATGAPGG